MEIYLVGGAVRDQLLGLPIKERDWVVVSATPQQMLEKNFKQVGRDFPVFLHPTTHEEYALARTERKTGKGYTKFVCHFDPGVTLEEDLKRRDLTINAIAQTLDGKIIDPYGGYQDLKNQILRHVSPAFAEDPVRILRVARFAARFDNFKIHPKTIQLMHQMLLNGEVDALVPERVWQELERALKEQCPEKFFITLNKCHALPKLFPELVQHLNTIKKNLRQIVPLSEDQVVRFAVITANLELQAINHLCNRYKVPNIYKDLSMLVVNFKNKLLNSTQNADAIITLLEQLDAYRRPQRLQQFLLVSGVIQKKLKTTIDKLQQAYQMTKTVKLTSQMIAETNKQDLSKLLHEQRKLSIVTMQLVIEGFKKKARSRACARDDKSFF